MEVHLEELSGWMELLHYKADPDKNELWFQALT